MVAAAMQNQTILDRERVAYLSCEHRHSPPADKVYGFTRSAPGGPICIPVLHMQTVPTNVSSSICATFCTRFVWTFDTITSRNAILWCTVVVIVHHSWYTSSQVALIEAHAALQSHVDVQMYTNLTNTTKLTCCSHWWLASPA